MFGLGHVERGTRRALIVCWPRPARVRDLLEWSYPRVGKPKNWHRTAVHRAVKRWAVVVGKDGRANLWLPNAQLRQWLER